MRTLWPTVLLFSFNFLSACSSGGPPSVDITERLDCSADCTSSISKGLAEPQVVAVRDDQGGRIIEYALQMMKFRDSGARLKFIGRCDSACTIYLALPRSQTCINSGASFGFHAPLAATPEASQLAQEYLLKNYPEWVKSWIAGRGGLTKNIMTMDYSYASKFLDRCDQKSAWWAGTNQLVQSAPQPQL